MGVIDSQNRQWATPIFTIAGGVKQSGVYQGTEATIPIEELIAAAGGLEPNASLNLRILRNNSLRFQIYLDPAKPDPANRLMSGDIVLVQTTPAATPPAIVPVVCVGLLDRPVVLPLDPTIQTLAELTARLGQSPDVAKTARLVSPVADPQGRLLPGTIVYFAPQLIDRTPLQMPGALPEMFALKRPALPQREPPTVQAAPVESQPSPTQTDLVMASGAAPVSAPSTPAPAASVPADSAAPAVVSNGPASVDSTGGESEKKSADAVAAKEVAAEKNEKPVEDKKVEASESATANAPATVSEPAAQALEVPPAPQVSTTGGRVPPMSLAAPVQPVAGNESLNSGGVSSRANDLLNPEDPQLDSGAPTAHLYHAPYVDGMGQVRVQQVYGQPVVSELNVHPTQMMLVHAETPYGGYQGAGYPEFDSGMVTPAMGMAQATTHVNTLDRGHAPFFAEQAARQAMSQGEVRETSGQSNLEQSKLDLTTQSERPVKKEFSSWGRVLSTIFGAVFLISAGLVIVSIWSPWKKYQFSLIRIDGAHDSEEETAQSRMQETAAAFRSNEATISASTSPPKSEPVIPPVHFQNAVSELVQRTVPVVEEPVVVPNQWPLHGQVVGHRRIILNQAHETIASPHFPIESPAPVVSSEKVSRQSIDERTLRANLRAAFVPKRTATVENVSCEQDAFDTVEEAPSSVSSMMESLASQYEASRYDEVLPPVDSTAPRADAASAITGSRDFDIVQPDHSPIAAMSPLDRALRTLASEKRG